MSSSEPQCHGEEEGLLLRNSEEELLVSGYTLRARVMGGGLLLGLIAFVLWALVPSGDHASAATSSGQSLSSFVPAAEGAWDGAGEELGIQIWRIEKYDVVPWPEDKYGKFCDGDCYLVLNTHEEGGERHYDVHVWIGKGSTGDEEFVVQARMKELDTLLDDKADRHKEYRGKESALFRSYFNNTITLWMGGVGMKGFSQDVDDRERAKRIELQSKEFPQIGEQAAKSAARMSKLVSSMFPTAGEELGLQVWRGSYSGDEYKVVPSEDFGKFDSDRPYVVLNTFEDAAGLRFDLHGLTGLKNSARARTNFVGILYALRNLLKNSLGPDGEMYVEFQGKESNLFKSYFDPDVDPEEQC